MRTLGPITLSFLALACAAPAPQPASSTAQAPAPATPPAAEAPEVAAAEAVPEGSEVGRRAPDFILPTSDGGGWNLAEHRGRPVVLAFFRGTW